MFIKGWINGGGEGKIGCVCLLGGVPVWDDGKILKMANDHDNSVNILSATIKGRSLKKKLMNKSNQRQKAFMKQISKNVFKDIKRF